MVLEITSIVGSNPTAPTNFNAAIAQLVVQFLGMEQVMGSSPICSSTPQ